ncbi:hypothetical protein SAMN04490220_1981 [Rhodococcus jostii]|uniref:Uncharacterized protein n=1 Tax=Rhodococcus jostii TaxID=132919 RepID=A0A1H4TKN5_RHOJO|nr:hypothetical protein SAMN04490220_1981 [Rhodococcus jostii]
MPRGTHDLKTTTTGIGAAPHAARGRRAGHLWLCCRTRPQDRRARRPASRGRRPARDHACAGPVLRLGPTRPPPAPSGRAVPPPPGGDVVRVPAAHALRHMLCQPAHTAQIRHQMQPGDDLTQVPGYRGLQRQQRQRLHSSHGPRNCSICSQRSNTRLPAEDRPRRRHRWPSRRPPRPDDTSTPTGRSAHRAGHETSSAYPSSSCTPPRRSRRACRLRSVSVMPPQIPYGSPVSGRGRGTDGDRVSVPHRHERRNRTRAERTKNDPGRERRGYQSRRDSSRRPDRNCDRATETLCRRLRIRPPAIRPNGT